MGEPGRDLTGELAGLIRTCLEQNSPLNAFNDIILGRGSYWSAQRQILRALWDPDVKTVAVVAGHSVGKSYLAAGVIFGWLALLPQSRVMSTSPSNVQLSEVLWGEIRAARAGSLLADLGRITKQPNKLDFGDGWQAMGFATNKAERMQGMHSPGGPYLVVVDEASGITDPSIWATLMSLKPDKYLLISNPIRAYGHFYDTVKLAEKKKSIRVIRIPSTISPDIHLERSERGLADAGFLQDMRDQYGEGSQTWMVRVEAKFPDGSLDALIESAWLLLCKHAIHEPGGHRRIAADLAGGKGGDNAVVLVRDDNGIKRWHADNRSAPAKTAALVAKWAADYGVAPHRITYDATFKGADFASALAAAGLTGCRPYYGGDPVPDKKYPNLRTASYFALRRRLDPSHLVPSSPGSGVMVRQRPFYIPADYVDRVTPELRELTHEPGPGRSVVLRSKQEMRAALKFSPDLADTLAMSFSFNG